MMKVKMIQNQKGSPDGVSVVRYKEGEEYSLPPSLAQTFIREGWAKEIKPIGPDENKIDNPKEIKDMNMTELKALAKSLSIKGYTQMERDELEEAVKEEVK